MNMSMKTSRSAYGFGVFIASLLGHCIFAGEFYGNVPPGVGVAVALPLHWGKSLKSGLLQSITPSGGSTTSVGGSVGVWVAVGVQVTAFSIPPATTGKKSLFSSSAKTPADRAANTNMTTVQATKSFAFMSRFPLG